ncbi:transcriptional regulator CynR [Gordonia sp. TBRC 11910]|uniref:Transcriptional regulator CynR n=1 Tax=Gordonia asplenii TaxID=2725283 RepID=A0A848KW76_9ACTN|nr:transcriptional regulator CynR [Gordonia asplenii]NMO02840.1 transcriptional regulator CynR [Gordonia asplenii]
MELRHIRYVLAVADNGSFSRGAEALGVSQPTLSQQIKQLEDELGAQLLDRTGRAVRLTDVGAEFARYARSALHDLEAAERAVHDVSDLTRGHLRLAVIPTITAYLIGPVLRRFHERFPGVRVTITESTQDQIEADLLDDRVDLGIGYARAHPPAIQAAALFVEALGLVVGQAHPLATQEKVAPSAIAGLPLALLTEAFVTRRNIDDALSEFGVTATAAVEADAVGVLIDIARGGVLGTVLPAEIGNRDGLRCVAFDPPLIGRQVELVRRAAAYHTFAGRAFAGEVRRTVEHIGLPANLPE